MNKGPGLYAAPALFLAPDLLVAQAIACNFCAEVPIFVQEALYKKMLF
jgi:hypothetical protein